MVHVVFDTYFSLFLKGLKIFLHPGLSLIVPLIALPQLVSILCTFLFTWLYQHAHPTYLESLQSVWVESSHWLSKVPICFWLV